MDDLQQSEEVRKARQAQHAALLVEVDKRRVANADNFDKSILTYSSTGLALSLGFLKDFVPIAEAHFAILLYGSWALFVLAIVVTMASYLTSQFAQLRLLEISRKYNVELQDAALQEINWPERLTVWGSYVAGSCFFLAIVGSTLFVGMNLDKGKIMTKGFAHEDIRAPLMQDIPAAAVQKGAPAPIINVIPQVQPGSSAPAAAPAPTPAQPSSNGTGK